METTLKFVLKADTSQGKAAIQGLTKSLRAAGTEAEKTAGRGKRSADTFSGALGGIGKVAGAIGITFGALQIANVIRGWTRESIQFEQEFASVRTLVDSSVVDVEKLRSEVLSLGGALGSSTELTRALYQALSAGTEPAQAVELVGEAAKLAKAGLGDVLSTTDLLTTALNAYGDGADMAAQRSDQLFTVVALGKTTISELANSLGRVLPTAAAAGIEFEDLSAAVAALTASGVNTREAVSGLKAAIANVAKPTKEAADTAARLGIEFNLASLQSKGFATFLGELTEAVEGDVQAQADLFGSIEAFNTVAVLASTQGAARFTNALEDLTDETNRVNDAFKEQTSTLGDQTQRFWNNLSTEFIIASTESSSLATGLGQINDALEEMRGFGLGILEAALGDVRRIRRAIFGLTPGEQLLAAKRETEALIEQLFELSPTVDELNRLLKENAGANDDASDSASKLNDTQKDLVATFTNSLRPAEDLGKEIDFLLTRFERDDVVALYADKILEVAERHERLNGSGSLPKTVQLLKEEIEELRRVQRATRDYLSMFDRFDQAASETALINAALNSTAGTTDKLRAATIKNTSAMVQQRNRVQDSKAAFEEYNKRLQEGVAKNAELSRTMEELAIRTFDRFIDRVSTAIVDFKGFWDAALETTKAGAKAIVEVMLREFLSPINDIFKSIGRGLANLLSGKGFSGGGGGFSLGGLLQGGVGGVLGLAGIGGLAGGALGGTTGGLIGAGIGALVPTLGSVLGIGGGAGAAAGVAGVPGFFGGGALGGSAGGGLLGGLGGLFTGLSAIPVFGGIAAGIFALTKLLGGKSTPQKLSDEALRDFAIEPGDDFFEDLLSDIKGADPGGAFGSVFGGDFDKIRKDITSSPEALSRLFDLAESRGPEALEAFLRTTERIQTVFGTLNLREELELFKITGDASALNEKWAEFFSQSEALVEIMPDFATRLAAADDEVKKMAFSTAKLLAEFQQTGEITPELSERIQELGGDMAAFEAASRLPELANTNQALSAFRQALADSVPPLVDVNGNLNDSINLFLQTGQVTDALRQTFVDFGGDLAVLDEASRLPGLRSLRSEFAGLQSELEKLVPRQETAMQLFLRTGQITDELAEKIRLAGGDLQAFADFGNLRGAGEELDRIREEFILGDAQSLQELVALIDQIAGRDADLDTRLIRELNDILLNGGDLDAFFASLGDILEQRTADTATTLADQLQMMQETLGNQIGDITARMIDEIDKIMAAVGDNIADINARLVDAVEALTEAIENLDKVATNFTGGSGGGGNPGAGKIDDIPSFDTGGLVSRSGLAFVDRGERVLRPDQAIGMRIDSLTVVSNASDPKEVAKEVVQAIANNKGGTLRQLRSVTG